MAQSLQSILDAPIIELDTIDSTNNYAMHLIDADTAQAGLTIVAREQTKGKGQRGRVWLQSPGESLLMSMICVPEHSIDDQFLFNAAATVAIIEVLQQKCPHCDLRIKWPNDIIINDKKAGGVLIENVIRGNNWAYSVIGAGINVLQARMPEELPYATSLFMASGHEFDLKPLILSIREEVLTNIYNYKDAAALMSHYNDYLYRKGSLQRFEEEGAAWEGRIEAVNRAGQLLVYKDDKLVKCTHGAVNWQWE